MKTLLIEVACKLKPDDPRWEDVQSLALEIGYPAKGGAIIWKQIGWLKGETNTLARPFSYAIWTREMANQILEFDFLVVTDPITGAPEKQCKLKKTITPINKKAKIAQSLLQTNHFEDEFFSVTLYFPEH